MIVINDRNPKWIELIVVFFVNETGISTTWLSFVCLCDFAHPKDMCSLGNLANNGYGLWVQSQHSIPQQNKLIPTS